MYAVGGAGPSGVVPLKRFQIGATVVAGQVVVVDASNIGLITDPSANDYTEAVGVTIEAGTYAASTDVAVFCSYLPFQLHRGACSNGATAGTDLSTGTDEQILTQTSASTTVITSANVGTSDFITGLMIGLDGANEGQWRVITSHSDNTSETVTKAFAASVAVGDTLVRTFGPGNQGLELCTSWTEFNMKPGAGVNLPDTGHAIVRDIRLWGQSVTNAGLSNTRLRIDDATTPYVEVDFVFADHFENSVA